jgi:hypothetical protein
VSAVAALQLANISATAAAAGSASMVGGVRVRAAPHQFERPLVHWPNWLGTTPSPTCSAHAPRTPASAKSNDTSPQPSTCKGDNEHHKSAIFLRAETTSKTWLWGQNSKQFCASTPADSTASRHAGKNAFSPRHATHPSRDP